MTGTCSARAPRALVVDDEEHLARLVADYLTRDGFVADVALDGERALELARAHLPDVVILDLMLPGIDGVEVCRRLRAADDVPILMLTARDATGDRVRGLDTGADDYVVKPFAPEELMARVRALLRRRRPSRQRLAYLGVEVDASEREAYRDDREVPLTTTEFDLLCHFLRNPRQFGDLAVDPAAREVSVGGRPVELTKLEFDLLDTLSARPRVAFSRRQLVARVWGEAWFGDEHIVDVHIVRARDHRRPGCPSRLRPPRRETHDPGSRPSRPA